MLQTVVQGLYMRRPTKFQFECLYISPSSKSLRGAHEIAIHENGELRLDDIKPKFELMCQLESSNFSLAAVIYLVI